jgi:ribosomal-protein-alanine N-acetyltransferase
VLARAGFREEGLLKRYLEVDGAWRDHLLVAVTVEELMISATSALVRDGRASWT